MTDKYPSLPEPNALQRALTSFLADYELRGEDDDGRDGCYTPNETERYLIEDFVWGLMEDDDWKAALASRPAPATATASEISDELDVALSRACVKAWDASSYTSGECDAVHPMYAAAFETGARAILALRPAAADVPAVDVRAKLAAVTQLLKDGDALGASLALVEVEKELDALATPASQAAVSQQSGEDAGLLADAERYRWLRDTSEWEPFAGSWLTQHDIYGMGSLEMDDAIDKLRAARQSTPQGGA